MEPTKKLVRAGNLTTTWIINHRKSLCNENWKSLYAGYVVLKLFSWNK